jgi:hypothetical protein
MEDEYLEKSSRGECFTTMLPDPLDLTSCNYLPTAGIPDAFYRIKQAFLKEEAGFVEP